MSEKILFVSHENGIGGATISLITLINTIKKNHPEIECDVIVPKTFFRIGNASEILKKEKISFAELCYRHDYKKIEEPFVLKNILFDLMNAFTAVGLSYKIKKKGYSAVVSNSTAVDIGARASFRSGIPHIQYVRELMEEDYGYSYRNKRIEKNILEKSQGCIFVSDFVKEKYIKEYHLKDYIVIANGFNVHKATISGRVVLRNEKIVFLQLGRLCDGKGTLGTIRLMNLIKKQTDIEFELYLVGNASVDYKKRVISAISEYGLNNQVTVLEHTNNPQKYLSMADLLIMNSSSEAFGRTTVEGMLAGCLVLGRDAGGTKEIIKTGETGVLFKDEKDAYNRILEIARDRQRFAEMAVNGQRYAACKFDSEKNEIMFVDYCKKLLSQR